MELKKYFTKLNKEKIIKIFEYLLLIIYSVFVIFIVSKHECYEDETQSWLIARDLNPIEIIAQMKYEGHSFLWLFIIMPFAKLNMPVISQSFVSAVFAILTAFLILKKSPFNLFFKIILVFCGGSIFLYSVIARPYCLIPFLLACIAYLYKNKSNRKILYSVCLALLANTHLIMVPVSFLLMCYFFIEEWFLKRKELEKKDKIKLIISIGIDLLGIIIMLIIAVLGMINCKIAEANNSVSSFQNIGDFIKKFWNTYLETIKFMYGKEEVPLYFQIGISGALILALVNSIKNVKMGLIFWGQFIFTLLVHTLTWFILPSRVYVIIYTLMFWLWTAKEDSKYEKKNGVLIGIALVIIAIFSAPSMYKLAIWDVNNNFSAGKVIAEYISENIPENSVFICSDTELQQSIIAYLGNKNYKFYMPNSKEFFTFVTWDEYWKTPIRMPVIKEATDELNNDFDNIYILNQNVVFVPRLKFLKGFQDINMDNFYIRDDIFSIYRVVK